VLSRYVDAIMIRTTQHDRLLELTEACHRACHQRADRRHASLPDHGGHHDLRGASRPVKGKTFAWTGDGNNVLHSMIEASARFDFNVNIAAPEGSEPQPRFVDWARRNGGAVDFKKTAEEAVTGADAIVTDCWVSMGQEHRARGHNVFMPYQVNAALMKHAKPDTLFMHCLPAHRGEEVTDEVIDGPNSVVFDEAENRLHAQKAVLAWCLGA
jgi:ornithine carbamoyltransferase